MSNFSDFQRGQIAGARLAGASVTETSQLLGASKVTVSEVVTACTQREKTSSTKQNSGRKQKLSEKDRRVLKRFEMSKKRAAAAKITSDLNQYLNFTVSVIS
ncbi:transposable element Tcb1 transposase [Trichonephila clavipes]|nr:transposable element Tcb1 transposase [Trichonephila clavipes]